MRADVRQGHASHTRHRRDDPPQQVGALSFENFPPQMLKRPISSMGTLSQAFFEASQRSIHRAFLFFPEFLIEAFPIARLPCIVSATHYLGIAICLRISFDLPTR